MEDLKANIQGDYFIIPEGTKNIRRNAFQFTCFSSITIPDSVEYIGDEAFSSNNCLEHLTIPNSVSGIGTAICSYCENLIDVTFEDSLDEIPGYTFTQNYNLTGITFPRNVKYIGMSAFGSCSCLTDMVIPNSVSGIGDSSFSNCISLTSITLPNELRVLEGSCFRNDGALQNITIPAKVSEIGYRAFQNCSGLTEMTFKGLTPPTLAATSGNNASLGSTTYTFPFYVPCESLEAYKTAFGSDYEPRIFCNSGQTMPTALTLNVDSAITDNGEATVTIEPNGSEGDIIFSSSDDTVATIDQNGNITVLSSGTVTICAYDSRSGLEDCKTVAVIKSSGTPSGDTALEFTYLTTENNQTIHLINGDAEGSSQAMYNFYSAITAMEVDGVSVEKSPENIKCYTVPAGLCWYEYTFENAGLHTVKFYVSSAITNLGTLLFSLQGDTGKIVSANIGSGITDLTHGVFQSQETLSSVTLPDTLLRITSYPFEYTGIKSLTIPDSVTAITSESYLRGAFNTCSAMTDITIGSGITIISGNTFRNCSALKTVTVKATTPPTLGNNEFNGVQLNNIYVPAESVEAYKAASGWSSYSSIISAIQ